MFCSFRGVSLSQELCCTQLARLFAREHSNREKRVKCDQGFTVHSVIRLLLCKIFMICGYHNYAASGYVIRYEHACSALSQYLSRHRLSEISNRCGTKAANCDSGRSLQQLRKSRSSKGVVGG